MDGGMCQSALEDVLLSMNSDARESHLVLRNEETNARLLISALNQISSPECRVAAIPFLCMHLFGLCDSSGVSIQPTSGQCRNIRDNICRVEWQTAVAYGLDFPDCNSFPEEQASCHARSNNGNNSKSQSPLFTDTYLVIIFEHKCPLMVLEFQH